MGIYFKGDIHATIYHLGLPVSNMDAHAQLAQVIMSGVIN